MAESFYKIKIIQNAPKTRPDRYTYLNKMNLETESLNEILNDLFAKSKILVSV